MMKKFLNGDFIINDAIIVEQSKRTEIFVISCLTSGRNSNVRIS